MDLFDDTLAIIVAEATAQFFVVHGGLVLFLAPHLCHRRRLKDFELIVFLLGPLDQVCAFNVDEKLKKELPQLNGTITFK